MQQSLGLITPKHQWHHFSYKGLGLVWTLKWVREHSSVYIDIGDSVSWGGIYGALYNRRFLCLPRIWFIAECSIYFWE